MKRSLSLILLAAALSACSGQRLKYGEYSSSEFADGQPRECRLIRRADWSEIWLDCRQCSQMANHVKCPVR